MKRSSTILKTVASLFLLMTSLTGCSVFMASQGAIEPDTSIIQVGADRHDIEERFGKPIRFIRKNRGDEATYLYHGALEGSYKRAAIYALADVVTLGFAEFITTPTEHMRREQFELTITYDPYGKVKDYTLYSNGIPSALPNYKTM